MGGFSQMSSLDELLANPSFGSDMQGGFFGGQVSVHGKSTKYVKPESRGASGGGMVESSGDSAVSSKHLVEPQSLVEKCQIVIDYLKREVGLDDNILIALLRLAYLNQWNSKNVEEVLKQAKNITEIQRKPIIMALNKAVQFQTPSDVIEKQIKIAKSCKPHLDDLILMFRTIPKDKDSKSADSKDKARKPTAPHLLEMKKIFNSKSDCVLTQFQDTFNENSEFPIQEFLELSKEEVCELQDFQSFLFKYFNCAPEIFSHPEYRLKFKEDHIKLGYETNEIDVIICLLSQNFQLIDSYKEFDKIKQSIFVRFERSPNYRGSLDECFSAFEQTLFESASLTIDQGGMDLIKQFFDKYNKSQTDKTTTKNDYQLEKYRKQKQAADFDFLEKIQNILVDCIKTLSSTKSKKNLSLVRLRSHIIQIKLNTILYLKNIQRMILIRVQKNLKG